MSGHSKWATIKRKKGAADAKRGKMFTKLIREITVSAKIGGGDVGGNPRLRSAVAAARAQNMPNSNIERAIAKATGDGDAANYEEIIYEGYGPGRVAFMVAVLTDNRNRTAADVRSIFTKRGGSLGESNSVRRMFDRKGQILIEKEKVDEDTLMGMALDAGAEDIKDGGETFEVLTAPADFEQVREALEKAKIAYESAEVAWLPNVTSSVSGAQAESVLKMFEALEDLDDVQNVYANYDIDEAELEKLNL
ncbi:MAG: YebC/PmpR family DNA-binding transcriptional regulator [Myxococcota bacterium]